MAELTATEQLERARKSIELAQDRVKVINQKLPELENELEDLIVVNEIKGYKGRTIEKTQSEIEGLQKEKATLEKTIEVLKKKLPELERAAKIELASTETVIEYREAMTTLKDCIESCPGTETLEKEVETIQSYMRNLSDNKDRYLTLGKQLNKVLLSEKLTNLGDITIERLKVDRGEINYLTVLSLSDSIVELSEKLKKLQYEFFVLATNVSLEYYIQDPVLPHINETCNCGLHRREFIPGRNCWDLYEYRQSAAYFDKWEWTLIHRVDGFDKKPQFQCESKNIPEFSACGRFMVGRKSNLWILREKKPDGSWATIKESKEKPAFPDKLIAVVQEKEEVRPQVSQMVYGNESEQQDPDQAFQPTES